MKGSMYDPNKSFPDNYPIISIALSVIGVIVIVAFVVLGLTINQ